MLADCPVMESNTVAAPDEDSASPKDQRFGATLPMSWKNVRISYRRCTGAGKSASPEHNDTARRP